MKVHVYYIVAYTSFIIWDIVPIFASVSPMYYLVYLNKYDYSRTLLLYLSRLCIIEQI